MVSHYARGAAIRQKLGALIGRAQVQARDLFDLHLLLTKEQAPAVRGLDVRSAIERAMEIGWDEFRGQVVAWLEPDQQALWADRSTFEQLQADVVERLEALE